mmetsp:Transcript_7349/g.18858  ORF Transcript_7349/g.18858 Transcript_7349/m.18858 type:complete len:231 (+) Transcript_7349:786-1478(+)
MCLANLADRKRQVHGLVDIFLLTSHLDVGLRWNLDDLLNVRVLVLPVGVEVYTFCDAVNEGLVKRLGLRDCLHNTALRCDKPDRPLPRASTTEAEDVASGFPLKPLQPSLHFVVRDESLVPWMRDDNHVPGIHDLFPRLKESGENVELKSRNVMVVQHVYCLAQRCHLFSRIKTMDLSKCRCELIPADGGSVAKALLPKIACFVLDDGTPRIEFPLRPHRLQFRHHVVER